MSASRRPAQQLDEPVELLAPAKLTLGLRVTGVRDDGMHLIDAEMVSVDLFDDVVLLPPTEVTEVSVTEGTAMLLNGVGSNGAGAPEALPDGDNNLVLAALDLVGVQASVALHKRIGIGAGLGGGSSDAAAVVRWANQTGRCSPALEPSDVVQLGADVAFCLRGSRARVRGIGEVVEPLPPVAGRYTLLSPPFGVDTASVYAAWDALARHGQQRSPGGAPASSGVAPGNDLWPAALTIEPRLARWAEALGEQSGQTPRLAGSGSTLFVEGHFDHVVYEGVSGVTVNVVDERLGAP